MEQLNFSRALWRLSGQYGPSLHRVINETAFQPFLVRKRGFVPREHATKT
jgi:hypothetical protein